jgi:Uma2 family endonuclease
MIQAGILTENDPVELLEGWIVRKMPRDPSHDGTIELCEGTLRSRLPTGWKIRGQSAITTADSEPEPDIVIAAGTSRTHINRHPDPQDIAVIIEVAESSLSHDRREKGRVYARAGILCYWIINLVDRQVEVYNDPTGPDTNPAYRRRQDFGPADAVPLVVGGQQLTPIPVVDLLP